MENKKKKKLLIKYIITYLVFILIAVFVFININRIKMFSYIISSNIFSIIAISMLFVSISYIFIYYTWAFAHIFFSYLEDKDYSIKLYKVDKKLDLINFIFKCFLFVTFILTFIFTPCTVSGTSMENTFLNGDNIICVNMFNNDVNIDDIIVFDSHKSSYYIKRVVAKENDLIRFSSATLYVNDKEVVDITNYQYKIIVDSIGVDYRTKEFRVPEDKILVLGDNRNVSEDSRYFGFIDKSQIFGKVIFRFYPFDKIKTF